MKVLGNTIDKTQPSLESNYIKSWYDANSIDDRFTFKDQDTRKYENGMLISISNHKCRYESLYKDFDEIYISLLKALKGDDYITSKWNIRKLIGNWKGHRISLPSKGKLLDLCNDNIPIMLCGIHNYKPDDIRSYGKEYTHSHFYIYNIHKHLPTNQIELKRIEDKIERNLYRYAKTGKRLQGIVRLTEVGIGKYKYTDNVNPLKLYDYLNYTNTNPQNNNVINYISNNRHLPSIQYPITTIYHNKRI